MGNGTLSIRVRPLRVGFLVDPQDRAAVQTAIEISTMQWGGGHNPIIPTYRRMPHSWDPSRRTLSPAQALRGYLDAFDPDIVVPIGTCAERKFDVGHRELIDKDKFVGTDPLNPTFGIGFIEALAGFVNAELKFQRNDNLHLALPIRSRRYGLFMASVLGAIPAEAETTLDEYLEPVPGVERPIASLDSLAALLDPLVVFPRRVCSWRLDHAERDPQLFVCDASNAQDIIDYWNLRASGRLVFPVPVQLLNSIQLQKFAQNFICEHSGPGYQPGSFFPATVQKARSVPEDLVRSFCSSLDIPPAVGGTEPRFLMRMRPVRIWSGSEHAYSNKSLALAHAHTVELPIPEAESRMEFHAYRPKFDAPFRFTGKPKFVNELSFRFYGGEAPMAEVLPAASRGMCSALEHVDHAKWRFSETGLVFFASMDSDRISFTAPRAEPVMVEWLRERGWDAALSPSGRMAAQLLKQLGGLVGAGLLTRKGLLPLFNDLEREGGLPRQAVIEKLRRATLDPEEKSRAESFFERLVGVGALRLGAQIQCPTCTRHNWFELDQLDYRKRCRFCLTDYAVPAHSPKEIRWTYRVYGPFSGSAAQGAISVLLTLRFLSGLYDRLTTPLFSYVVTKGEKSMEADLTCLYQSSAWQASKTEIVHAECKTFNAFESADFDRMRTLGEEFPGSVLLFATLRNELSSREVKSIRALANAHRRRRLARKPNSHIVVLTATELQSFWSFPQCWQGKGANYERFAKSWRGPESLEAVSDITLQMHLAMPSWNDWVEQLRQKRELS